VWWEIQCMFCCKFSQAYYCQNYENWFTNINSCCKNKNGVVFLKHSVCMCVIQCCSDALPRCLCEFLPDRERSIISEERMRQVKFVGHVAVMTQVTVVTLGTVPASTTHSVHMTHSTDDALMTYTCRENTRNI